MNKEQSGQFIEYVIYSGLFLLLGLTRVINLSFLTIEDGFVEYLSAFFWLIGIVFALKILSKNKLKNNLIGLIFLLVSFISLGEEISWGQRIFNFSTPESIASINRQKEFNFHNLNALTVSGKYSWREFFRTGKFNIKLLLDVQNAFRIGFLIFFLIFPLIALNKRTHRFYLIFDMKNQKHTFQL